jgi:hypothetical protein
MGSISVQRNSRDPVLLELLPTGGVSTMDGRRCEVTVVGLLLRRVQLGEPDRRIARELGVGRNTVARYRRWAAHRGLLDGELPDPAALAELLRLEATRVQVRSCVAPFRAQILALRQQGVGGQALWQLMVQQHGFTGSYSAIKRFLRRLDVPAARATMPVETTPGEVS